MKALLGIFAVLLYVQIVMAYPPGEHMGLSDVEGPNGAAGGLSEPSDEGEPEGGEDSAKQSDSGEPKVSKDDGQKSRISGFNRNEVWIPNAKDYSVFNEHRRDMANRYKISSMDNLKWDENLARRALSFSSNCDEWVHGEDYRFSPLVQGTTNPNVNPKLYVIAEELKDAVHQKGKEQEILRNVLKKHDADLSMLGKERSVHFFNVEHLHPVQTTVGCARKQCEGRKKPYSYEGVCLFGPKGTIHPSDIKFVGGATDSSSMNLALGLILVIVGLINV